MAGKRRLPVLALGTVPGVCKCPTHLDEVGAGASHRLPWGLHAIPTATLAVLTIGRPTPVAHCGHVNDQRAGEIRLEQSVFVSDVSFASDDPDDIVASNASFVAALRAEYLREDEIPREALLSYCVDYY